VSSSARGRGIGTALRLGERNHCRHNGVDVVNWWIDPLRSVDTHVALNKLGGIATAYSRNVFGELGDSPNRGLATDRLQVEWWVESPRVISVLDRKAASQHLAMGLHQMDVLTKTAARPAGYRTLLSYDTSATSRYVLAEIPTDLDRLRREDPEAARRWRLGLRELLEVLLSDGFVVIGLIHEAGRSFHLLEQVDRSDVLGRP